MTEELYKKLSKEFPKEALVTDSSRFNPQTGKGIKLTSIKAQYVRERLNEVLGFENWETETFVVANDDTGVAVQTRLTVKVGDKSVTKVAFGGSPHKKNIGDTFKSAETDALCKAASNFGVGNDVFKGLIDAETLEPKTTSVSNGAKTVTSNGAATSKPSFRKPRKTVAAVTEDVNVGDDL